VTGLLHKPAQARGPGLVLTHGAGGNARAELLVRVAEAFADAGWFVLRYDLPFRQRKPFGPPMPAGAAEDRAGLRLAVGELKNVAGERVCLGGHSYGGRQASMLLAEEPELADGLLLLSYPLHPPKKPAQLRTAHFEKLRTPTLFVHGAKDEFGTAEEMHAALRLIAGRTAMETIEGAGHDLKKGAFDVRERVVEVFARLITPK
jgi:predicted alpha/beta-hydrolase family hydrolase